MTPEDGHRTRGLSISSWLGWARGLHGHTQGQSVTEYALFLGLLTLAVIGAITIMSGGISDLLTTLAGRLANSVS